MASWRKGRVVDLIEHRDDLVRVRVDIDGDHLEAVGFPRMLGPLKIGDVVVLNTTGLDLDLGTGGVAFILWNLDERVLPEPGAGHIVKLRYTPWQSEVVAAESPESDLHEQLSEARSIDGMPVVVCGLHSQMAAAVAGIKAAAPGATVGYLMTDGAALPIAWSRLVAALRSAELLDVTCTAGHSFGGELESVNAFSGLIALRVGSGCDAAVVSMGPGVVGTGTALGFTAMEQGQLLDAVTALGGRSIAALRVSFVDPRRRHAGVSHHAVTALTVAAREPTTVVVPELPEDQAKRVRKDLDGGGVSARHEVIAADGTPGVDLARAVGIDLRSMGRPFDETPELFLAAAAAGQVAGEWLSAL